MPALNTDKLRKGTSGFSATLTASISNTDTTIALSNVNNLATDTAVELTIDRVDSSGTSTPTKREVIIGVVSGLNIVTCLRGQDNTTAQSHSTGAVVECIPTGKWSSDVAANILTQHNQDGTHSAITASSLSTTGNVTVGGNLSVTGYPTGNLADGWIVGRLPAPNTVTYNGNRSYDLVFNSTDLTGYISPGMRLRTSRTSSAPTYMGGLLNGSTQYFTKVTPSGTLGTVTDNFTLMAWVQPTTYATGVVMGRSDTASNNSFEMRFESDGRISVAVFNAGVANNRTISTYQSLPINKRTHVTATWATGTVVIYFDGVAVPTSAAVTGGTAPTTAGTGGDWSIGKKGAYTSSSFFPGYISGVGVFNAVLSAATIRSYIPQVLSGSETNCIGAWSLNNTLNDQNAAGNTLTAQGSAGFTAISPYSSDASNVAGGTYDYAIVQKAVYSGGNTTLTVQVPEGNTIPTSGGVSAVAYSGVKAPFGMPVDKFRWSISAILRSNVSTTSSSYGTSNFQIGGQTGQWDVYTSALLSCIDTAATADTGMDCALSTSTSAVSDENLHFFSYFNGASSANLTITNRATAQTTVNLSAPTTYYMIYKTNGSTTATIAGTTAQADIVFTPSNL